MLYMAKNHNLWHRVALTLEKAAIEYNLGANNPANDFAEWDNITQQVGNINYVFFLKLFINKRGCILSSCRNPVF